MLPTNQITRPTGQFVDLDCHAHGPAFWVVLSLSGYENGGGRVLEVLPMDLYYHMQNGRTFGQIAGDYHLEHTEFQVSVLFHICTPKLLTSSSETWNMKTFVFDLVILFKLSISCTGKGNKTFLSHATMQSNLPCVGSSLLTMQYPFSWTW